MKKYAVSLIYSNNPDGRVYIENGLYIVPAKNKKQAIQKAKKKFMEDLQTAKLLTFEFSVIIEIKNF